MKSSKVKNLQSVTCKKLKAELAFFHKKQIAQWTKITNFHTDLNMLLSVTMQQVNFSK